MKVVVTGGLGYLGAEVCSLLCCDPRVSDVIVFDKAVFGVTHVTSLIKQNLKLVIGDIRDRKLLADTIQGADVVIHLASLVGAPLVDRKPVEALDTNLEGAKVLSSLMSSRQRLIFASTGSCYGRVDSVCTEETKISPLSSYGRHKAEGERIFSNNNAINLRFATVYGLSFRTRNDLFVNNMVRKALLDQSVVLFEGNARRTFIHVHDAARALVWISLSDRLEHLTYNVGDEKLAFTKREICELIGKFTNFAIVESEFNEDPDQRDYEVSYRRLSDTGFNSIRLINDEILSLFKYYQALQASSYENG